MTTVHRKAIIVDGKNLLWRASSAYSELSLMIDGERVRTGAMYGFVAALLRLGQRYRAPVIVAWEGGDNFRIKLWPDYKRKRAEEVERDLQLQEIFDEVKRTEGLLNEFLSYAGVRQYYGVGCEADDVIATVCTRLRKRSYDVVIYSGDSDLRQLVKDDDPLRGELGSVFVVAGGRSRGISGDFMYDEKRVRERHGVEPFQIPLLKALGGDNGDGIPGLPRIGEKTAAKLISHYGTLEAIVKAAREEADDWPVPKSLQQTVAEGEEKVKLFLQLTIVLRNAEMKTVPVAQDAEQIEHLLRRFRFHSFLATAEFKSLMKLANG